MRHISVTVNTYCWIQVKCRGFPHSSSVNKLFSYWLICEGGVVYPIVSLILKIYHLIIRMCGQTNVNYLDLVVQTKITLQAPWTSQSLVKCVIV